MEHTDLTLEEMEVALMALVSVIGMGHSIKQDPDTGFVEILPCGVGFERCAVEVEYQSIVETRTETVQGFQPQVLRCDGNYPHSPDDLDYDDLGEAQPTFFAAVVVLASELSAEAVGDQLADWSEAKALASEGHSQERT